MRDCRQEGRNRIGIWFAVGGKEIPHITLGCVASGFKWPVWFRHGEVRPCRYMVSPAIDNMDATVAELVGEDVGAM